MSHHLCQDNWEKEFFQSLKSRLPRNFNAFYHYPIGPNSITVSIGMPVKTRGRQKIFLTKDITKSIAWAWCSPYTAASIFLYAYFKGGH